MRIRENLSPVISALSKDTPRVSTKNLVGKVYGVVTTQNTPTKEMFEKVGGFNAIGTIFYLDYDQAKNTTGSIDNKFLDSCKVARPFNPQIQNYPLINELVSLTELPGPASQVLNSSSRTYYTGVLNIWSNQQQNSQPANNDDNLGVTFVENSLIKPLLSFEGDNIIQGRQGSALRFSSTSRPVYNANEWSEIGNEDDPITILTNGLKFIRNQPYYTERINKDDSSIYLTSAQKILLLTDKTGLLNNLTNPLNVPDYYSSQVILNADRVVLNSKKDEVMLFAETNVEINTKNIINLNADTRVHLNTNSVFLGPYDPVRLPQPVLLGKETAKLFIHLFESLARLAGALSKSVGVKEGSPILGLVAAGDELFGDLITGVDLLAKTPSTKVFISPNDAIQTSNTNPASTDQELQIIQASYRTSLESPKQQSNEIERINWYSLIRNARETFNDAIKKQIKVEPEFYEYFTKAIIALGSVKEEIISDISKGSLSQSTIDRFNQNLISVITQASKDKELLNILNKIPSTQRTIARSFAGKIAIRSGIDKAVNIAGKSFWIDGMTEELKKGYGKSNPLYQNYIKVLTQMGNSISQNKKLRDDIFNIIIKII